MRYQNDQLLKGVMHHYTLEGQITDRVNIMNPKYSITLFRKKQLFRYQLSKNVLASFITLLLTSLKQKLVDIDAICQLAKS